MQMEAGAASTSRPHQNLELSASNCYSECIASRKVTIPFNEVSAGASNGTIAKVIRKYIASQIENKCTIEGFVHPNTCKILSHSSGMLQGQNVQFDVAYSCSVFLPCEGAILVCRVKSVTNAGILAGINGVSVVNPVVVYVLREHHASSSENDRYFNSIKPDAVIRVKVVGQRFELNDAHVSVIGELLQPDAVINAAGTGTGTGTANTGNTAAAAAARRGNRKPGHESEPSVSDLYFEHQTGIASCGRHALNHLLQREAFVFSVDIGTERMNLTHQPSQPINLHKLCFTMKKELAKKPVLKKEFECLKYENHSVALLMAALSLVNYTMENPSNDRDTVAASLLSMGETGEWKMLVNENGSPHGGHWTAVIKNGDDPTVYYFNSLLREVKTYANVDAFVDTYIREFSSLVQFAFVQRVDHYTNPLYKYQDI